MNVIPVPARSRVISLAAVAQGRHLATRHAAIVRIALERAVVPTGIPSLARMTELSGGEVLGGLCRLEEWGELVKCQGARYALRQPDGAA